MTTFLSRELHRMRRLVALSSSELRHSSPIEPLELQFRLNSVWTGAWMTILLCIPAILYVIEGGSARHRPLFLSIWILALISGAVVFFLPWRRIIESHWRELVFLMWALLDLALIALAAFADGGLDSPVTGLLFAPIVFVGASYPMWSVKLIGALGVSGYAGLAAIDGQSLGRASLMLGALGGAAAISAWTAHNHELRRQKLDMASVTDPLTGALNRRGLDAAAASELGRVERHGVPVALLIIDLDQFKPYNDTHGHLAGDQLLAWFADTVRSTLRPSDTLARIGGDEFAVLVAHSDADAAEPLAERIREACGDRVRHCTGIASAPADGGDFDSLYRAADLRLYEAKRGRLEGSTSTPGLRAPVGSTAAFAPRSAAANESGR
jgi:diguanylate cyclase (GGDEF)-like protein